MDCRTYPASFPAVWPGIRRIKSVCVASSREEPRPSKKQTDSTTASWKAFFAASRGLCEGTRTKLSENLQRIRQKEGRFQWPENEVNKTGQARLSKIKRWRRRKALHKFEKSLILVALLVQRMIQSFFFSASTAVVGSGVRDGNRLKNSTRDGT